jgi:prophage regulatory protein
MNETISGVTLHAADTDGLAGYAILRVADLAKTLKRSRSAIYAAMNPRSPYYEPHFPKRVRLSARAVGWRAYDVAVYLRHLEEVLP